MPADRNDSISPRHRRKLFAVWFALFLFMVVGLGTTTGLAANGNGANNSNGNPGHTPDANHGGSQQGQQYPTPNGGRGIPGCGPSDSQPKKCHDQQTPSTPENPGGSTPSTPSAPGGTNAPATSPQQGVLGTRTTTGSPSGSNGPANGNAGNAGANGVNATAHPAAAVNRKAPFTG